MDIKQIKRKAFGGAVWNTITNFTMQLCSFIIQVILARIIEPSAYGTIAMVTFFIAVANVFVTTGFASALIQKKEISDAEASTSYYIGLIIAIILYIISFIGAPLVAYFYENDLLIPVLRFQALSFIFGALTSVHNVLIQREFQFRKNFLINFSGIIVQGIVGITLAVKGYGVWALVISYTANKMVTLMVTWATIKWRPKVIFSLKDFKNLFSFSSRVLILTLIDTVFANVRSLIIGKRYDEETLAYYNRGYQIPDLVASNGIGSLTSILFPALSRCTDSKIEFKLAYRRAFQIMYYISFPVFLGLVAIMPSFTKVLLTDKWNGSIVFGQIICLGHVFDPFLARQHVYNAKGRSDISMFLGIADKIVITILLYIAIIYGNVYHVVLTFVISNLIAVLIGIFVNVKCLDYSIVEQIKDMLSSLLLSLLMFLPVYYLNYFEIKDALRLIIQIILGIAIYLIASIVFRNKSFQYILRLVKENIH